MAWYDHEELKPLEARSYKYMLTFPSEYADCDYFVRAAAFGVLNDPTSYSDDIVEKAQAVAAESIRNSFVRGDPL